MLFQMIKNLHGQLQVCIGGYPCNTCTAFLGGWMVFVAGEPIAKVPCPFFFEEPNEQCQVLLAGSSIL